MPHFIIEYSANLDGRVDWTRVCDGVRRAALETGVFPVGGVRVRTLRCDHYSIADGDPDYAFVDMSLRMGSGRTFEQRRTAGEVVFQALEAEFRPLFDAGVLLALSFEVREIDGDLAWRRNAIHEHLKRRGQ